MNRKEVKALLEHYSVVVNGKVQTKHDYPIKKGDSVLIDYNNRQFFLDKYHISIIYEDSEFLVINKPNGLLSVAGSDLKDKNQPDAFNIMNNYIKLDTNGKCKCIFTIHRLDKETSGVLVFSKSRELKELLQEDWNGIVTERLYYAVAEGVFGKKQDTLISYLAKDKQGMVYSIRNPNDSVKTEKAVTTYNVIRENASYSLLDIGISSGKKNQIRVSLKETGHPVAGDKKYGAKTNPLKRLTLHAYRLSLKHPVNGKMFKFETKMPETFNHVFKKIKID